MNGDEQRHNDVMHLALIRRHIRSLEPDQEARIISLAERVRELLNTEPDQDLAHLALALLGAESLVAFNGGV